MSNQSGALTEAERSILSNAKPPRTSREVQSLTPGERELLQGFEKAIAIYGNPSVREIAKCAGRKWYYSNAHTYLIRLAAKGYVQMPTGSRPRSIRLLHRLSEEPEAA